MTHPIQKTHLRIIQSKSCHLQGTDKSGVFQGLACRINFVKYKVLLKNANRREMGVGFSGFRCLVPVLELTHDLTLLLSYALNYP